jgi:predicted RNA-binding protein (virulence factor B family)
MIQIGQTCKLSVVELSQFGAFLDGDKLGNILLPNRYVPEGLKPGDQLEVFIYLDSEDRLVATTEKPLVKVGQFAFLKVVAETNVGAFLDWGLPKNLLVPFREQKMKMKEGESYLVFVYLDDATKRVVASSKIDRFTDNVSPAYEPGDKVDLIIGGRTDLGYKAIIDHKHMGMLYNNEIFRHIQIGQQTIGYVKQVRPDDKIDLSLQPLGYGAIDEMAQKILNNLNSNNGFLPLTDHSSPEEISAQLGISKKAFKKAIGALYRQRLITIEEDGLRLMPAKG